jgi:hypothetical protein
MLTAMWGLFQAPAGATVYDDFNQAGIDSRKWTISGTHFVPGLFSQPGDGRLHFDPLPGAETTGSEKLTSTATYGPQFFSLEFYNFSSTNLQPPGSHQGAFIALGLTDGTNFVRIIRDQNGVNGQPVGVFEVNYNIGSSLLVHYVETTVSRGKLGLNYDGTKVTFYYDSGNGWQHTGWKTSGQPGEWVGEWTPDWGSNPRVYLQGYDLYGLTSVRLDTISYLPVLNPGFLYLPLIRGH